MSNAAASLCRIRWFCQRPTLDVNHTARNGFRSTGDLWAPRSIRARRERLPVAITEGQRELSDFQRKLGCQLQPLGPFGFDGMWCIAEGIHQKEYGILYRDWTACELFGLMRVGRGYVIKRDLWFQRRQMPDYRKRWKLLSPSPGPQPSGSRSPVDGWLNLTTPAAVTFCSP